MSGRRTASQIQLFEPRDVTIDTSRRSVIRFEYWRTVNRGTNYDLLRRARSVLYLLNQFFFSSQEIHRSTREVVIRRGYKVTLMSYFAIKPLFTCPLGAGVMPTSLVFAFKAYEIIDGNSPVFPESLVPEDSTQSSAFASIVAPP